MYERSKTSKAIATNRSYNYLIKPSKNICQIKVSFQIKTDLHNIFCSRPLSTINDIKIIFPIFPSPSAGVLFRSIFSGKYAQWISEKAPER